MHGVVDLFFDKSGGFYRDSIAPPEPDEPSGYWIELDPAIMKADHLADCDHCYLYLDFVGRQTLVPGRYGHVGMSRHIVVIDKVLLAKPVGQRGE
jgi:hypothetical protein